MKKLLPALILALILCTANAPADSVPSSAVVYPVFPVRSITAANAGAKKLLVFADGMAEPLEVYAVPDETAHIRIEVTAQDDPGAMVFSFTSGGTAEVRTVTDLYDPSAGAFIFDCPMTALSGNGGIAQCLLSNRESGAEDPGACSVMLITDESVIDTVTALLEKFGFENVRWEFAGPCAEKETPGAYILHVTDQSGKPVPGVFANFCTDTFCAMTQSDMTGTITFGGDADAYHVQLLKVPAGYSADPGFEFSVGPEYGEWVLRIQKN